MNIIFLIFFILPIGISQRPEIKNFSVSVENEFLTISLELHPPISQEVVEIINAGIEATMTFNIELCESTFFSFLFEKKIAEINIKKKVIYELNHKSYKIVSKRKVIRTKSPEDMLSELTKLQNIKIYPVKKLGKNIVYYLKANAEFESVKMVPPLNIIFDLLQVWNFKTPYYKSKEFYGKEYNVD